MDRFSPLQPKTIDVVHFRRPGDGRLVLSADSSTVMEREISFTERYEAVAKSGFSSSWTDDTEVHQQENKKFKAAFYNALVKAEGPIVADSAVKKAGLPTDWQTSSSASSSAEVKVVLKDAERCRMRCMRANDQAMREFIDGKTSPQLLAMFEREVKLHPKYTNANLTRAEFEEIESKVRKDFNAKKEAQFKEAYPYLAQFSGTYFVTPNLLNFGEVCRELTNMLEVDTSVFKGENRDFCNQAQKALSAMEGIETLLSQMSYVTDWTSITTKLDEKINQLTKQEEVIGLYTLRTAAGEKLQERIIQELRHQKALLNAKKAFIEDIAKEDPFSEKAVAYSNLLWAHAAQHILSSAQKANISSPQKNVRIAHGFNQQQTDIARFVEKAQRDYDQSALTNQRVAIPSDQNKSNHPVIQGKKAALAFVKEQLKKAGFSKDEIKQKMNPDALQGAWRFALDHNQDWRPYVRTILVHKEGVTRSYTSIITPAGNIAEFAQRYQSTVPLEKNGPPHAPQKGVSSADKANHYHARNLKLSELICDEDGSIMAVLIGHGVLDMWDIKDEAERAEANKRGAKEVLELARVSNTNARDKAATKYTHVSINQITPSGMREPLFAEKVPALRDYQEQTYTHAQFKAFDEVSGQNSMKELGFHVDVISFSFGINPLATGVLSTDIIGGWTSVDERNYKNMQRFIGNLGSELLVTKQSRVQGQRPGGFIGSVLDKLEAPAFNDKPNLKQLATKLKEQTNIVRELFLTESYKRGNGDPAKMSREILALQAFAEQALAAIGSEEAATMSKGCKSDKDRGGVVDVELKYKLITEDLGGVVVPDAVLTGEDQNNYLSVAVATQFRIHQLNTGLPGSKAVDNLDTRIPKEWKAYLAGLSKFSQE